MLTIAAPVRAARRFASAATVRVTPFATVSTAPSATSRRTSAGMVKSAVSV